MGYVFDVYYKIRKPENHFGHYALFVSFFPQIQSGPIGRSKEMLPQWLKISRPTWLDVRFSILLFSWGVLKKLVIADRLGNYVDEVYQQPDAHGTFVWLFILALYTFQLYADFSAYTDMAIASARVLGIKISENFMYPYKANNITDFWRRWHLSLSNWLRDYVYTPLLFSKKKWKKGAVLFAIAVTFVICGIWHGPKMTFVVFGILQAAFLIFEMLTKESRASWSQYVHPKLYQSVSVMLTFSVISFCFIFFRAENMEMVRQIFHQILNFNNMGWMDYVHQKNGSMLLGILAMIILFVLLDSRISEGIRKNDGSFLGMTIFNACLWVIIVLAGVFGREVFIYFQF
jgi:D-alanyl-lipoteichoic acid acyltransferase DltB (MBOAT superfamily)